MEAVLGAGRMEMVRIRHPHSGSFSVGQEEVVRIRHPHDGGVGEDAASTWWQF